jgi:hypothetical protein
MPRTLPAATTTTSGLVTAKNLPLAPAARDRTHRGCRDHVVAAGSETPHDRGADHAAVTRNLDPLISEIEDLGEHHIDFPQYRTLNRSDYGVPARAGP